MKIKYLGTAAAEGIPAVFCDCEACKKAREMGGKFIRTRSQAIIDDKILIDFPADTYMHYIQYNFPLAKIKSCLITHSHSDHLYVEELGMRKDAFSKIENKQTLTLYSDKSGYDMIMKEKSEHDISDKEVAAELIELYKPFDVEGYKVTALRANHPEICSPVVFIIEKDGKSVFYSNDTGGYCIDAIEYLKTLEKPLDLVSLDCTSACSNSDYFGHFDFNRCIEARKLLKEIGAADENTKFILNHFSHNGKNVSYDEFTEIASKHDFDVSYDGMEVEI